MRKTTESRSFYPVCYKTQSKFKKRDEKGRLHKIISNGFNTISNLNNWCKMSNIYLHLCLKTVHFEERFMFICPFNSQLLSEVC